MGFALWLDEETAWAQGTHEYRPMGVAVLHPSGAFTPRDFRRSLQAPSRYDASFAGFFASLGEMNDWLAQRRGGRRRSQDSAGRPRRVPTHLIPPF